MFDKILHPFAVAVAWVWVKIHDFLVLLGFSSGSGVAWVISIVLLTIIVRILILPLFLKQIKSSRAMQAIQPEVKLLQEKYKGKTDQASRVKQSEETQALYKKYGVSPFASCLPLLVQLPILFAMYRAIYAVKDLAAGTYTYAGIEADRLGPITQELASSINGSTVFGVPLSHTITSGDGIAAIIVFVILIGAMMVLQFFSMRISMVRNMPPMDSNNPMMQSQKSMLYVMPLMYLFSGGFFQMGVIIYMVTAALWAIAQTYWTIKVMPTPGSSAYEELLKHRHDKYLEWAKPFFASYDEARSALPSAADDAQVLELNEKTFTEAAAQAKKLKVATDFPESMSPGEKVSILRNLASQEWTTLPDEVWMRTLRVAAEKAEERRNQQVKREQNKRLSREERQTKAQRQHAEEARKDSASDNPAGLSAEEIERRRQERRKARRKQNKKKGH
ncbi:membrane protein insertase YidC [Schaalia cardiffensis]